jgi:hypothetical protein
MAAKVIGDLQQHGARGSSQHFKAEYFLVKAPHLRQVVHAQGDFA